MNGALLRGGLPSGSTLKRRRSWIISRRLEVWRSAAQGLADMGGNVSGVRSHSGDGVEEFLIR